jgi:hypothetical protein
MAFMRKHVLDLPAELVDVYLSARFNLLSEQASRLWLGGVG